MRRIEYRGVTLEEMDIDAVIARDPQIAIVDELAHTDVPGSKNRKRYEDVFELLNHDISVITAVNIQHIESTTVNGLAVVKIFLQPGASLDRANAQVTAVSQTILRQLPGGTLPPLIINFSASSVPILQLALSGENLTEPQLNDIALNFLRTQLVTVPGAAVPFPYGGKQRQVMVWLNPQLLQSKGVSPADIVSAVNAQNLHRTV